MSTFIRANGLNDIDDVNDPKLATHNDSLRKQAEDLIGSFGVIDRLQFTSTCERPFEAAKIAMSFYRRIKELVTFEKQGLVRFPTEPE
ncbi:MAG: hypothetical protein ACK5Q5_02945 [Planctomycetaceae bacterium]